MKPQESHSTRLTQNGFLFQIRSARNGATNARLSVRSGPSQITHFETSITQFTIRSKIGDAQNGCSKISIVQPEQVMEIASLIQLVPP
jgi:hypothetical protein